MTLKVYNTLTNQLEPFKPLQQGKVHMYLCGPTVYDHGHLGHGRSAVAFDVIRRYLEYHYGKENVIFVTNYTDIDDKMINRANEEKITVSALADRIIPEYEADYAALGIKPATKQTKATDYIPQMIEIIEKLIEKGNAYETDDGIYFEIETFSEYGKLSNQKLEELRAGSRVETNENKHHPYDFVLWKKEKPGEPAWNSPWGKGRPGWHIECSAMSRAELGQPFDIHGGGADLTFPHHECEIAQSEAAYGTSFCQVWLHNGFITVNQEKMSKSLGNFFTLKTIFEKYNPRAVRYLLLSTHYRSPIEFSDQQLEQAQNTLEKIDQFAVDFSSYENFGASKNWEMRNDLPVKEVEKKLKNFEDAMNEDFDTPKALAVLFELISIVNKQQRNGTLTKLSAKKAWEIFYTINEILNINPIYNLEELLRNKESEIKQLIKKKDKKKLEQKGILTKKIHGKIKWWWKVEIINAKNILKKVKRYLKSSDAKNTQTLKEHIDLTEFLEGRKALSSLISMINPNLLAKKETDLEKVIESLEKIEDVINDLFGLGEKEKALIQERDKARAAKDWTRSDELRDELHKKGILVEDTPNGTVWKKI